MDPSRTPDELKRPKETDDAPSKETPAAGPHAKPHLTNEDATPGVGSLPDPEAQDVDGGAG